MRLSEFRRSNTGVSAVEFALVAPVLVLFLFGIICFATVFSIASGLQQLAAEAARASVAGLSDTERTQIAQSFIANHVAAYPFIIGQQLTIATSSVTTPTPAFQVSLSYDLTDQIGRQFGTLLPLPVTHLQKSAVVLTSSSL